MCYIEDLGELRSCDVIPFVASNLCIMRSYCPSAGTGVEDVCISFSRGGRGVGHAVARSLGVKRRSVT